LAKLIINPTSGAKKEIPIGDKILSIGRDPSNDLVLSDSMVSRRHAIMERKGEEYVIRDNNSSNGTMVNGDRVVSDQRLRDGDLIAIGSARLLFQLETEGGESDGAVGMPPSAMKTMEVDTKESGTTCPGCGLAASSADLFCRRCGKELAGEKPRHEVCGNCGATVELPAEFCGGCGKPLHAPPGKSQVPTKPKPWSPSELSERAGKPKGAPVAAPPKVPRTSGPARARPSAERVGGRRPGAVPSAAKGSPAGFWIRFAAYLIDFAIQMIPMMIVMVIFLLTMFPRLQMGQEDLSITWVLLLTAGWLVAAGIFIAYPLYFWTSWGATPGKSLLRLKVVTTQGQSPIDMKHALLRLIGYMINGFTFGIGFLLIVLSEDRRGLHDRIAETAVVRKH
jgi:uncharacterized RDD family membrane protein YckC